MLKYFAFVGTATVAAIVLIGWTHGTGTTKKAEPASTAKTSAIERGRYLIEIGGCNDCHTEGFIPSGGKIPASEWLKGSVVGFKGPWGTTYPKNLRVFMDKISESEWVTFAKNANGMPPMPWWALHAYNESDLRAIYAFVRSLGPVGEQAPAALAPGAEPQGPYIDFNVHNLPPQGGH